MNALKNYFILFFIYLIICFTGKGILAYEAFSALSLSEKCYAIFYGYKFDCAVAGSFAFLATLGDLRKNWLLVLSLSLGSFLIAFLVADIIYYQDTARHIGYELRDSFAEARGLLGSVLSSYLRFVILGIVGVILWMAIGFLLLRQYLRPVSFNRYYPFTKLILIAFTILFVRGIAQHIPLNPSHAYKIGDSRLAMLSLNGVYHALFNTLDNRGNVKITTAYAVENEVDLVHSIYAPTATPSLARPVLNQPNIVILFLESWGGAFFKDFGGKYDVAPHLHHLLMQSLRPKAMMAGGHRTAEGVFTTLTSWQNPLGQSVAKTQLQNFNYTSLIDLLKNAGYTTAFFQGSNAGTSAGNLAQKLGFTHSYGRDDVKIRRYEENSWGVQDPDLYHFVLTTLEKMPTPFVIGINGVTTHDTILPKSYSMVHFSDDKEENTLLNTYHFSDEATFAFIQQLEKRYPNTLFVLMADHVARLTSDSNFLQYLIPFALYSPQLPAQYIDQFVSQRDVAPTIVDLTLGDYRKLAPNFSGKSLIQDQHFLADYYANGVLGVVHQQRAVEWLNGKMRCYAVDDFIPQPTPCNEEDKHAIEKTKAFTNMQQRLLFQGKTRHFHSTM